MGWVNNRQYLKKWKGVTNLYEIYQPVLYALTIFSQHLSSYSLAATSRESRFAITTVFGNKINACATVQAWASWLRTFVDIYRKDNILKEDKKVSIQTLFDLYKRPVDISEILSGPFKLFRTPASVPSLTIAAIFSNKVYTGCSILAWIGGALAYLYAKQMQSNMESFQKRALPQVWQC